MCSNNLKLPIRAAPYRHQQEAAAFALDKLVNGGGAALLMEMGTGKTLTTIAIVGRLWQQRTQILIQCLRPLFCLKSPYLLGFSGFFFFWDTFQSAGSFSLLSFQNGHFRLHSEMKTAGGAKTGAL